MFSQLDRFVLDIDEVQRWATEKQQQLGQLDPNLSEDLALKIKNHEVQ